MIRHAVADIAALMLLDAIANDNQPDIDVSNYTLKPVELTKVTVKEDLRKHCNHRPFGPPIKDRWR